MKYLILNVFSVFFLISASCDKKTPITKNSIGVNNKMTIKIGDKTFTATLYDNATATAFKAMLPMTINMTELNGNEKFFRLKNDLPVKSANPETIKNGDLMIYSANTLVLFYKNFSTTYSYTKLGRITDTTGLAEALGNEDATVTFE